MPKIISIAIIPKIQKIIFVMDVSELPKKLVIGKNILTNKKKISLEIDLTFLM